MAERDLFIDVVVEVGAHELLGMGPETASRTCIELTRRKADEVASEKGARLRTDVAPEFSISRGTHPLLGGDIVLIASRWHVVATEDIAREVLVAPGPNRVG